MAGAFRLMVCKVAIVAHEVSILSDQSETYALRVHIRVHESFIALRISCWIDTRCLDMLMIAPAVVDPKAERLSA